MEINKVIDLRSDTLSMPTNEMRRYIYMAEVGDNLYHSDTATNKLEEYCCELFKSEAALFVCSGFLANQLAIRVQCCAGEELISDASYHINMYEYAATSDLGKVTLNLTNTKDGIIRDFDLENAISSRYRSEIYSKPKMLILENTINSYGGKIVSLQDITNISNLAKKHNIKVHLDGARLINASVATNTPLADYMEQVDSLSFSFSKGLGAPFGSVLLGSKSFISEAKKYQKWYGAGLHQSGFMAEAAMYALKNNISNIKRDHENAKFFANELSKIDGITLRNKVETNIVMFDVNSIKYLTIDKFISLCNAQNLNLYKWNTEIIRAVLCLNISKEDVTESIKRIHKVVSDLQKGRM